VNNYLWRVIGLEVLQNRTNLPQQDVSKYSISRGIILNATSLYVLADSEHYTESHAVKARGFVLYFYLRFWSQRNSCALRKRANKIVRNESVQLVKHT
jgi:hypothetical protein